MPAALQDASPIGIRRGDRREAEAERARERRALAPCPPVVLREQHRRRTLHGAVAR